MYVRNYGMPPRGVRKEDIGGDSAADPIGLSLASPNSDEEKKEQTEPIATEARSSAPESPNTIKNEENISEECSTVSVFGEGGIPRQPIRKRKLPKKTLTHGNSPKKDETPTAREAEYSEPVAPCLHPWDSPHHCDEPPCATVTERATPKAAEHPHPPRHEPHEPRKPFGHFSSEELFLGGLILLLINDRAGDDVLIILAFLLVSGFDNK